MMKTNGVHCQTSTMISVFIAIPIEPSQLGGSSPNCAMIQLTKPQSGLRSARHITPTTIGVISIGSTMMPRTIHEPVRWRLKNNASAVPSTTCRDTAVVTMIALFSAAFQNNGSRRRSA